MCCFRECRLEVVNQNLIIPRGKVQVNYFIPSNIGLGYAFFPFLCFLLLPLSEIHLSTSELLPIPIFSHIPHIWFLSLSLSGSLFSLFLVSFFPFLNWYLLPLNRNLTFPFVLAFLLLGRRGGVIKISGTVSCSYLFTSFFSPQSFPKLVDCFATHTHTHTQRHTHIYLYIVLFFAQLMDNKSLSQCVAIIMCGEKLKLHVNSSQMKIWY